MSACALGCVTRDGHPFPAPDGYACCDRCMTRLRTTVTEIAERWTRIVPTQVLLPGRRGIEQRHIGYESTPPGSIHVMALRDVRTTATEPGDLRSPLEVLHAWAGIVRRRRRMTVPESATVDSEAVTLSFHLDWIVREFEPDTLALFDLELSEVRAQLCAVTRDADDEPPSAVVGYCTATVDEVRCRTPLRLPKAGSTIRCSRCDARYDGMKLIQVRFGVQDGETMRP